MPPLTILEQAPSLSAEQQLYLESVRLEAHHTGALSVRASIRHLLSAEAAAAAQAHERQLKATAKKARTAYEQARDKRSTATSAVLAA